MLNEYKNFLFRGNLLDLAVAFIMGLAFAAVVTSFANDVIMGAVASLFGLDNVSALKWGAVNYGLFLAALISFVIIATVLFAIIHAAKRFQREQTPEPPTDEAVLLAEIRDLLAAQRPTR
jgi:large conductance mechanosensitive channel